MFSSESSTFANVNQLEQLKDKSKVERVEALIQRLDTAKIRVLPRFTKFF
nr:MAG TPA: hypothetical protein [Caudoviricetes sp.]